MPVLKEFQFNVSGIHQALEGIYSTIVLRDVLQRNPQINQNTLHKVMLFFLIALLLQTKLEMFYLRKAT